MRKASGRESFIERFFAWEAAGGVILVLATIAAIICSNSELRPIYEGIKSERIFDQTALFWVNDFLMAIFFFLVGLELKREFLFGELSERSQIILPAFAAFFGMLCPAIVYLLFAEFHPELIHGWAIPAATDIAFALGLLALLGRRVPIGLKVFLTTVAVLDDLGAIVIIALFYGGALSWSALYTALLLLGLLQIARRKNSKTWLFAVLGLLLWTAVLRAGIHPTIAGVALGLSIPAPNGDSARLEKLQELLHPWVSYFILPLFAFLNAGLHLLDLPLSAIYEPLTLAIALGLFLGKQVGIFGGTFLAVKSGLARLPVGTNWRNIHALSVICGIGFTMSLFIAGLAFKTETFEVESRLGVILGSSLSALIGFALMHCSTKPLSGPAK
jgi:NhaA family Na+:H+ antiporter